MKTRISVLPAMLLALVLGGCKMPTHPAYSPDGNALVFEKGGSLLLRSGGVEKVIGPNVEGDASWSPDGSKVVFYQHQSTVIYDMRSGGRMSVPGAAFPYVWTPNGLLAVSDSGDLSEARLIDPSKGDLVYKVDLPIRPLGAVAAGDGALIWDDTKTFYFDGLAASPMPELNGIDPVSGNGGELLLARKYTPAHTHRHLFDLIRWRSGIASSPQATETVDLGAGFAGVTYVMDVQGSRNGWLAASAVRVLPKASDRARCYALLDRYDVLAHILEPNLVPKKVNEELGKMMDRSSVSLCVFVRPPGKAWREAFSRPLPAKGGDILFMDISPDGSKLAITQSAGTREIALR